MENQDIDLLGETVGKMFYKIGIVDEKGNLKNQFVAKASTNRIDIPQSSLGTGGVPQIPSTTNLFSGSAVGDILLSGPSANYDNVQDGLLITLSNTTLEKKYSFGGVYESEGNGNARMNLSSIGLKPIKIPKEKLIVGNSFDISDQLSQYTGIKVQGEYQDNEAQAEYDKDGWGNIDTFSIVSFGGTTINVLPNTTISINLTVNVTNSEHLTDNFKISVTRVNTYKN